MGISVSNMISETDLQVYQEALAKCKAPEGNNRITHEDIKFKCASQCGSDCSFNTEQKNSITAECAINTSLDMYSKAISKLDNKAEAGFGISVANTQEEIREKIQQKIDSQCEGPISRNEYVGKKIDVEACKFINIQEGDMKSKCELDAIQKTVTEIDKKLKADVTGASLASLLGFGGAGLLLLLLIGGGFYAYSNSSQEGGYSGYSDSIFEIDTEMQSTSSWIWWMLFAVIIAIGLLMYYRSSNVNNNKIISINYPPQRNQIENHPPQRNQIENHIVSGYDADNKEREYDYYDSLDNYYGPLI